MSIQSIENDTQLRLEDKPTYFPEKQLNGAPLKTLSQALLDRRATNHFTSDPVPEEYLHAILRLGAQSPSGYNLQPWRFLIVRDPLNRKRLQHAAFDQEKVSEAPVVIIFIGMKEEPKLQAKGILLEGARRGLGKSENVEKVAQGALKFLSKMDMKLWVNRHTMIAFTTVMLAAETYGLDTAPLEGFDPEAVKKEFDIPEEGEVIALLAVGKARDPNQNYPGRFGLSTIAFNERYGSSVEA